MNIPRQLLTFINSGKCFALLGSGPSSAMGYPPWWKMAEDAAALVIGDVNEQAILTGLLSKEDYPEVFQRVADRIGRVANLLAELRKTFKPNSDTGEAYQHICRWPFRCYLTTNFDDEIQSHLNRLGRYFTILGNGKADFAQITGDSQRRVVKIHGDLNTPTDIVLTTSQYKSFETAGERQYFRSKLVSIFQMVPVVVIGHSMTDRDLQLVLQLAKESASPEKPTYMIVADAGQADIDKLNREFNIRLLSYPNPKGSHHSKLIQLLRQINRFVVPRTSDKRPPLDFPDAKEAETAVALYVHSSLRFGADTTLVQHALQPQVLALAGVGATGADRTEIAKQLKPDSLSKIPSYSTELDRSIAALQAKGLVICDGGKVVTTPQGNDAILAITGKRRSEEDQFFGSFRSRLSKFGSPSDVEALVTGFKGSLVTVLRKRGLSAAEMLFRENPYEPADMPELFEALFPPAMAVDDFTLRAEYCDAVMDIMTQPNDDQKAYLAHLAQGFFAFHMFGRDPSGQEIRRRLVQGILWLLDSNVLMPLVARHSEQYLFMIDLLKRLTALGIKPITTPLLVSEVDRAFGWMTDQLQGVPDGHERQTLLHVIQRPGYSDNPFVDAFILGSSLGDWRSLSQFKEAIGYQDGVGLRPAIESHGIEVTNPALGFVAGDSVAINKLGEEIRAERERVGTMRAGDVQAKAEAEVIHLIRGVRANGFKGDSSTTKAYFVSTSRLLDILYSKQDGLITWFPETLYKHLIYLDGDDATADSVFHALTTSYYTAGVSFVDESAYRQYFKPAITEATATLKQEVGSYAKAVTTSVVDEQRERESLLNRFSRVPDLEKPQYVDQLGWAVARRAQQKAQAAEKARIEAELRGRQEVAAVKGEYERKERERRRHEEGRLRNLADPKHQKKRLRQAKKRRKKRK